MYSYCIPYIKKKILYCTKKNNPTKNTSVLKSGFHEGILKIVNDCNYKIRHTHIVAKLNIRFDMTARKKGSIQKKSERHLWEKKTLKELFEWLQMNYYVERKKIVLSSLYSLLLHTTTTKLLRLKMKKKEQEFYECWLIVQWTLILLRANMMM